MANIRQRESNVNGPVLRVDFEGVPTYSFHKIPQELKSLPHWVCWKLNGSGSKVPVGSTTDPSTWSTFGKACARLLRHQDKYHGIGYVLNGGAYVGIDLDHCRDPRSGSIEPWAQKIISFLNSYTYISHSGTGFHVIVKGRMTGQKHRWTMGPGEQKVELWQKDRYLVATGNVLSEHASIRKCNVGALERQLGEKKPKDTSASGDTARMIARVIKETGFRSPAAIESEIRRRWPGYVDERNAEKGDHAGQSYIRYEIDKYLREVMESGGDDWRTYFCTGAQLDDRPLTFVIDRFVPEEGITGIGGLSGDGKTLVLMSMAKTVLTGGFLWGQFKTNQYPVLYLIPESGDRSFKKRMTAFGIPMDDERFLVRTMSQGLTLPLSSPVMGQAVKDRVVFLDTLVRFTEGKDEQQAKDMAALGELIFKLLQAGAVAIIFAHHSPKSFRTEEDMTLENAFRGSGDIGAIMAAGHAIKKVDDTKTIIHIQCVKPRDFEPLKPFQLQGRPWIDQEGDFHMTKKPGDCKSLAGEEKERGMDELRARIKTVINNRPGLSGNKICQAVGANRNRVYEALPAGVVNKLWKAKGGKKGETYWPI